MIPEGIVDSLWFDVVERCEEFGDSFDEWQDGLGQAALGLRADGMFAATVGGITLSIPRQVAKTFIVMRIVVALCTLFPNLTVLWTAHRLRTATNTFQKMKSFVLRPAVRGYLRAGSNNGTAIRDANGEQEIPFANGSRILFGAREQGFGRGFDEVDVEVFDEAQILTEKALEDMVAATNQSRFQHGALLFYMGTPPRPGVDPGEAFTDRRAEALGLKRDAVGADFGPPVESGDAMFVECSADANVGVKGGPSLDDLSQIEKANPSFPHRTPLVSVKRLRKNLRSDDGWRREGLGVWDDTTPGALITPAQWQALKGRPGDGRRCYGVRFSSDGAWVSLAVAVASSDGGVHVEVIRTEPLASGTGWLLEWLTPRLADARAVIDGKSGASVLINDLLKLRSRGRRILAPTVDQVIAAHTSFLEAVNTSALTHFDQPGLNAAVAVATKRKIGVAGGWGWDEAAAAIDLSPLGAVTLAHYGAKTLRPPGAGRVSRPRTSAAGRTSSSREAVVM